MIYFPKTKQYVSQEFPIAVGASVLAEGTALVTNTVGGVFGVAPSAGVGTEKFFGIAVSQQLSLNFVSKVEEVIVPASLSFTLARTPAAGTLGVYDKTAGAAVIAGSITLVGNTVTLTAAQLAHDVVVTYRYSPTVTEARIIQGDIYPGGAAGNFVGQVGVIKSGTVYTTEFDTLVNWNAAGIVITTGPNGILTIGGSGVVVPATVVEAPSAIYPYLGISLSAA